MSNSVEAAVAALQAALPADRVELGEARRAEHSHDYWALAAIRNRAGRPGAPPACVVFPESTQEVATVLRIADEMRVPVVPYGLGSGVCGAVEPGADAIVLATAKMARLVQVDRLSLTATAEPGLNGAEFERLLNQHHVTLGHFPQSIGMSSVGGWVATRASGQLSTRYGNIEDLVLSLEAVLPGGKIVRTFPAPRAATGPDLRNLFLGSEGTLGVVTSITFKVSPKADFQQGFAVKFEDFTRGLEVTRRILQAGWRPAVLRLYDEFESGRHFTQWQQGFGHVLLVMSEGTAAMQGALELELAAAKTECDQQGGVFLGEEPLRHWLGHRNEVPSWDQLLSKGLVVDTIEVAATWDRICDLHEKVTKGIQAVPGIIMATGHTSHGYTTGVNIYFTFVGNASDPQEQERIYNAAWAAAMEASIECGATIAHHHGIGRVRRSYLPREIGSEGVAVLQAVKQALDPHGIMNPGVLI